MYFSLARLSGAGSPPAVIWAEQRAGPLIQSGCGLSRCGGLGMIGGPGVDDVEHGPWRFGRDEAEHVLQQRVDHGMQPVVREGLPVLPGLPHLDVAQAVLDPVGQVGDQARRSHRADAVLDPGVDLGADRHVVGERVGHGSSNIDPKLVLVNIAIIGAVSPPVKRRYDASKRRQAAARTRQAILDAALELFTDPGYAATPMTAIAQRADVALDTVYASVGRKPELARLLIETAISGGGQAVPAEERDYVQAIRAAADAGAKIAIYASAIRAIAGRPRPPSPSWPRCGARSPTAGLRTCACSRPTSPRSPPCASIPTMPPTSSGPPTPPSSTS